MLADILPTGYEVGVLNGTCNPATSSPSSAPARSGSSAIMGARLFSPSHIVAIDLADSRLEAAKQFGADVVVNNSREDAARGRRASSPAGSAPTSPSRRSACRRPSSSRPRSIRPGGHVANIGVHGKPATLHLEELWIRDVTITTGLVDTYSTPTLLRLAIGHQLDAHGSSPTTSRSTSSRRPTTCSPAPPTPARSRSSSRARILRPMRRASPNHKRNLRRNIRTIRFRHQPAMLW